VFFHNDFNGAWEHATNFDAGHPRVAFDALGNVSEIDGEQVCAWSHVGEVSDGRLGCVQVSSDLDLVDLPVFSCGHLMAQQANHGGEQASGHTRSHHAHRPAPDIGGVIPEFGFV